MWSSFAIGRFWGWVASGLHKCSIKIGFEHEFDEELSTIFTFRGDIYFGVELSWMSTLNMITQMGFIHMDSHSHVHNALVVHL
jgi:hypothetical protein